MIHFRCYLFQTQSLADVKVSVSVSPHLYMSRNNLNLCQIVFYFEPRKTELLLLVASERWYGDDARGEFS